MTHETFGRFVTLAIFDFESTSAQNRLYLKVSQNIFRSKIHLNLIADIVFDLRNEFHTNRMKFGTLEIFYVNFDLYFDTPRKV
jgi:hypothetical protein